MKGFIAAALIALLPQAVQGMSLSEGLRIIEEHGRDIRVSISERVRAEEEVDVARAEVFPRVDAFARQTWLRYQRRADYGLGVGGIPLSEKDFYEYGFSVRQNVYNFGKTYATIRASRQALSVRQSDVSRVRNDSALEFILAYLDLLEAEKMVTVAKDEVERLISHVKDASALYAEGMVTKNDILESEVSLADARQRLLSFENARSVRESHVNSLLLRPLDAELVPVELSVQVIAEVDLTEALENAERERPELKQADAEILVREEEKKAVRATFFPDIFVSGGYNYEENRYMVHEGNWFVNAGATINLYSGGATVAKMKALDAEISALRVSREKLLDTIRLEVKRASLNLESAQRRIEVTEKAIDSAEENLRLQQLRYEEGVGTATDVLDAVALRSTAVSNYWNSLYSMRRAEAELHFSVGGDLFRVYDAL